LGVDFPGRKAKPFNRKARKERAKSAKGTASRRHSAFSPSRLRIGLGVDSSGRKAKPLTAKHAKNAQRARRGEALGIWHLAFGTWHLACTLSAEGLPTLPQRTRQGWGNRRGDWSSVRASWFVVKIPCGCICCAGLAGVLRLRSSFAARMTYSAQEDSGGGWLCRVYWLAGARPQEDAWHLALGTWHLAFGTWHLVRTLFCWGPSHPAATSAARVGQPRR
jgi:hypothetical protein